MQFTIKTNIKIKNCITCPLSTKSVPEQKELPMQIYCTAKNPKNKALWMNVTKQAYGLFPPYRCPLHNKTKNETEQLIKERIKW